MLWALLGLAVSHIYSFAVNYIGSGEYLRADAGQLLFQPYGRVVVLHVAILGGAFLLTLMGSPVGRISASDKRRPYRKPSFPVWPDY